jgi:HTH-type transcriptional regulator/antitoxin HigA
MNRTLASLSSHWQNIAPLVATPTSEADYQERLAFQHQLIDEVGEDEKHPLASLLNFVGVQIQTLALRFYLML